MSPNRLIPIALALSGLLSADQAKKPPKSVAAAQAVARQDTGAVGFQQYVTPVLTKVCSQCHNDRLASGGLNVLVLTDAQSLRDSRNAWGKDRSPGPRGDIRTTKIFFYAANTYRDKADRDVRDAKDLGEKMAEMLKAS